MKTLFIHPEDGLQNGPWAGERWDRIVDLGKDGALSREAAEAALRCPVSTLDAFRANHGEKRRVRELLVLGMGRLCDQYGLDWWELMIPDVHEQLEVAYLLQKFVETVGAGDEVYVSRAGLHADVLRQMIGSHLHTFGPIQHRAKGARHYLKVLRKFSIPQLVEIFWDKADPGFQFRGLFSIRQPVSSDGVILLPSAYVNVSRTATGYAEILPEANFLLVATRRSGFLGRFPLNVSVASLRRYASIGATLRRTELHGLSERWERLLRELTSIAELRALADLGIFSDFPARFARGLEVRDAWRNVLDREPVRAVICADTSNAFTHIPLLLAAQRGLPTIACHHGALDGRYFFKRNHAAVLLAKGEMERDYLVRVCEIPGDGVEIGAPALDEAPRVQSNQGQKSKILFFSEAYEVAGGRAQGFYGDILPRLADLAISRNCELIVKLHPSESTAERTRLLTGILSPAQQRVTRVVDGPLTADLLDEAWFGITVMSTVAVECALRQIPCFLCTWLEAWPYGYVDQFTRFGVGIRLQAPNEIRQIPDILKNYQPSDSPRENCWKLIAPQRLRKLAIEKEKTRSPVTADERIVASSMNREKKDMGALLIRADASVAMGTGHVMRCLALAQAFRDAGGRAVFIMRECTPAIRARLLAESCDVLSISCAPGTPDDARHTVALARQYGVVWIAVDGYQFGANYQNALKDEGAKVLFVDDYGHAEHYSADIVLNQNLGSAPRLYASRGAQTQLLLGSRYCLLRREFAVWRAWTRDVPVIGRHVLVTMGGSDPENVTARIVDALALVEAEDLETIVVMGGSAPHFEALEQSVAHVGKSITIRRDVDNIAELMAWADLAVSSAGTTCWELCLLGLPSLLVDVAENQTALARELDRRRAAIHMGAPRDSTMAQLACQLQTLLQSHEMRRSLAVRCRELVDGKGAERVVSLMRSGLRLRPAHENDCRLLWEWANDQEVRKASFSSTPIPWEEHKIWFAGKMKNLDCRILLAEDDQGHVGQFRVDWTSPQEGVVDVSVAPARRGAGYGAALIDLAVTLIFAERGTRLHAFVKPENRASRLAFEHAGFCILGEESMHAERVIHYSRSSSQ